MSMRKHQKVKVALEYRKEPDVRRIARAIIRMSMEAGDREFADQKLLDLAADEAVRRKKHHGSSAPEESGSVTAVDSAAESDQTSAPEAGGTR